MSKSPHYDRKRRAARYLGHERLNGITMEEVRKQRRIEQEWRLRQIKIGQLRLDLAYWQRQGQNKYVQSLEARIAALEAE
jgi:hypothetical protein